jgi:hypothetical protein
MFSHHRLEGKRNSIKKFVRYYHTKTHRIWFPPINSLFLAHDAVAVCCVNHKTPHKMKNCECWSRPYILQSLCLNGEGLFHTFRFSTGRQLTGRARAQLGTLITSPVVTGRSNDQESCDQAVVHAQWSAMDRNSITVLFFLYSRRRCRCNRLHWVHPIIQKKRRIRCLLLHYLTNYEMTQTSF